MGDDERSVNCDRFIPNGLIARLSALSVVLFVYLRNRDSFFCFRCDAEQQDDHQQ